MPYPTTDWPGAVDAVLTRVDLVDTVFADDFNYPDEQIRSVQSWLGAAHGDLIGDDGTATHGPGGLLSPIASGGTGITLATRAAFAAGKILSVGENYDAAYAEVFGIEATGELTVATNYIQGLTGAVFDEAADHPIAPAAGEGQIWVKNAVPCELWFTDDVGTDVQLSVSAVWGRAGTVLSPVNAGDTVIVGVGAVGAPGYSFETYIDSGMYLVSNTPDVLGFSCDGAKACSIEDDTLTLFFTGTPAGYTPVKIHTKRLDNHGGQWEGSPISILEIAGYGRDDQPVEQLYGDIRLGCYDDTNGAEDSYWRIRTYSSGAYDNRVIIGAGTYIGAGVANPSTRDPGVGNLAVEDEFFTGSGAAGAPSHSFRGFIDTGMWLESTTPDVIAFSCDGGKVLSVSAAQMLNVAGTAANPAFSFIAETDLGFWRGAVGRLALSIGGSTLYSWTSSYFYSATSRGFKLTRGAGSAAIPTYTFQSYGDAGMYFTAETRPDTNTIDTVHFSTEGVLRVSVSSTGLRVPSTTVALATAMDAGNNDTAMTGDMLYITDETGGSTLAIYDGTDFRRVQDRAIIS